MDLSIHTVTQFRRLSLTKHSPERFKSRTQTAAILKGSDFAWNQSAGFNFWASCCPLSPDLCFVFFEHLFWIWSVYLLVRNTAVIGFLLRVESRRWLFSAMGAVHLVSELVSQYAVCVLKLDSLTWFLPPLNCEVFATRIARTCLATTCSAAAEQRGQSQVKPTRSAVEQPVLHSPQRWPREFALGHRP